MLRVNLKAGVVVRKIDREEKEAGVTSARPGTVTEVVNGWRKRLKTIFSSAVHGEKRKNTRKMKPHRVRKTFQMAAG